MFWETKMLELQKLATVDLTQLESGEWVAKMPAAVNESWHKDAGVVCKGDTRAAAVVGLWNHLVKGNEPFLFNLHNRQRKIRWNARWEVLEEINEPTELVVEDPEAGSFDPSN